MSAGNAVHGMTPERAADLLGAARKVRVLVVGDVMLDRYITGSVERISPEAPVPVVRVEEESAAAGGAANVAANVAALGAACRIVGCVGRDAAGATLKERLDGIGIGTDGLILSEERPTTVKTRILARHQQVARVDHESDADATPRLATSLAKAVASLSAESDVLIAEDYDKGVFAPEVVRSFLDAGARQGIPTVVDPKRRNFFAYTGATVFKPNAKELADATGEAVRADDADWMEAVRRRVGCRHLLVTVGERGMALRSERGLLRIPTVARSVYDVSGAGDTVTAVVAVCVAAGATPAEAALLASHAAAVEVSKAGVATVSPEEILEHARVHQEVRPR